MNDPVNPKRRRMILGLMTLSTPGIVAAAIRTPSGSEGPFYPTSIMRFDDIDNDLVKIEGVVKQAGGEIVRLSGRVLDTKGNPVSGARIEIWQCDVSGRYLHQSDPGKQLRDPGFQGFGSDLTDASGQYSFRTIKPVPYPGRTPHIHLKIWQSGRVKLTSQLYLPDHEDNNRDWLYQSIPSDKRERVTLHFEPGQQEPEASVDLVI
jgi:protocatechuate 3,4-dioxygenase beta subunit